MKYPIYILTSLLLVACDGKVHDQNQPAETLIAYRDKPSETLAEIAYDLLRFEKYKEALDLVQEDTSMTALTVKIIANDGLGNTRVAIDNAILDLRKKDTANFYEGSWEMWDLYLIFQKDINYGLGRLNEENIRCSNNYQVRQLMMKLYWYLEDYEKVVALGDEFRKESPDLPHEVPFTHFRNDSLDSLSVNAPETYRKILASYKPVPWNGVEGRHD